MRRRDELPPPPAATDASQTTLNLDWERCSTCRRPCLFTEKAGWVHWAPAVDRDHQAAVDKNLEATGWRH